MSSRTFEQFLIEGGNVKKGDVSASPLVVTDKNRESVTKDLHDSLLALSTAFRNSTGDNLFGRNDVALHSHSTYSGSSRHLFDTARHSLELKTYKPSFGDVDVQVDKTLLKQLQGFLTPGKRFGKYQVAFSKAGGGEIHTIMTNVESGLHHQIDFEGVTYESNHPSSFDTFAHGSSWEDIKGGIKGAHRNILLNASGLDKYKFSILYGLGSRTDPLKPNWISDPDQIAKKLFGSKASAHDLESFGRLTKIIKASYTPKQRSDVYQKFVEVVSKMKNLNSENALNTLRTELGISPIS
jgi:hypothetical protein